MFYTNGLTLYGKNMVQKNSNIFFSNPNTTWSATALLSTLMQWLLSVTTKLKVMGSILTREKIFVRWVEVFVVSMVNEYLSIHKIYKYVHQLWDYHTRAQAFPSLGRPYVRCSLIFTTIWLCLHHDGCMLHRSSR